MTKRRNAFGAAIAAAAEGRSRHFLSVRVAQSRGRRTYQPQRRGYVSRKDR